MNLANVAAPNPNPAIEHCLQAARAAHAGALARQDSECKCEQSFSDAYLQALPDLATQDSVCAFIACVGYALTNQIVYREDARSYLYAAQVALCAVPRNSTRPKTQAA